jgi:hypothetical protein
MNNDKLRLYLLNNCTQSKSLKLCDKQKQTAFPNIKTRQGGNDVTMTSSKTKPRYNALQTTTYAAY